MNCEEARQNAAAYVLGALSEQEQAEFERHIAGCDEEHGLSSFSQTVERLAESAPEIEPPISLRSRILAAAEKDLGQEPSIAAPSSPADRERNSGWTPAPYHEPRASRPWYSRVSGRAYAAAASIAIIFAALIAWNVALQLNGEEPVQLSHFYREEDGDWLRVETMLGKPGMTLSVGELDQLDPGRTYEFWAIRDERWLSIGDFNTNPEGRWRGEFDFALEDGDSVAITVEPAGGSERPTADAEIETRI